MPTAVTVPLVGAPERHRIESTGARGGPLAGFGDSTASRRKYEPKTDQRRETPLDREVDRPRAM